MKIDGLTFHFYPSISDSIDNINIYIEEEKTLFANQSCGVMYNTYTLRGEKYRDPKNHIAEFDKLLALNAENILAAHGIPLIGQEKANRELRLQRDAMQFVYDQTIRYMNKGYTPEEIVAAVKISAFMAEGAWTRPIYGEFEHYVRGVYSGLIGWFGSDPLELHPVSKKFQSSYIVDIAGGADAIIEDTRVALDDNQYAWAAQLATYVLDTDPENADARALKAQALRKMGQVTQAANTRHWYTAKAWELEGKLDRSVVVPVVTRDKLAAAPRKLVARARHAALQHRPRESNGHGGDLGGHLRRRGHFHLDEHPQLRGRCERGPRREPERRDLARLPDHARHRFRSPLLGRVRQGRQGRDHRQRL